MCADLRGHGSSPKPLAGYGYDDHCADVIELLEALGLDDVRSSAGRWRRAVSARVARTSARIARLALVGSPPRLTRAPGFEAGADPDGCLAFRRAIETDRQAAMWQTAVDTLHRDTEPMRRWLYP